MSGLYKKYDVQRDGESVDECFVLRPETDDAARSALVAYAQHTPNQELADDLWEWVRRIQLGVTEDTKCPVCKGSGVGEMQTPWKFNPCDHCDGSGVTEDE